DAVAWVKYVPADAGFAHTALQVGNVCRPLQAFQFSQLLSVRGLAEGVADASPDIKSGCKRGPFGETRQDKELVQLRVLCHGIRRKLSADVVGAVDQAAIDVQAGKRICS